MRRGKIWLKFNIRKTKIMTSGPTFLWQVEEGQVEVVTDFVFYNILIMDNPKFKDFCNAPYKESSAKMYKEYDRISHYLLSQYPQTDISKLPHKATQTLNEKLQVLNEIELIKFINTCSNINLESLYNQIINNDYSILQKIKF